MSELDRDRNLEEIYDRLAAAGIGDVFLEMGDTSERVSAGALPPGLYRAGSKRLPFVHRVAGEIIPANEEADAAMDAFIAEGLIVDDYRHN